MLDHIPDSSKDHFVSESPLHAQYVNNQMKDLPSNPNLIKTSDDPFIINPERRSPLADLPKPQDTPVMRESAAAMKAFGHESDPETGLKKHETEFQAAIQSSERELAQVSKDGSAMLAKLGPQREEAHEALKTDWKQVESHWKEIKPRHQEMMFQVLDKFDDVDAKTRAEFVKGVASEYPGMGAALQNYSKTLDKFAPVFKEEHQLLDKVETAAEDQLWAKVLYSQALMVGGKPVEAQALQKSAIKGYEALHSVVQAGRQIDAHSEGNLKRSLEV